jgi:hypothetical protein
MSDHGATAAPRRHGAKVRPGRAPAAPAEARLYGLLAEFETPQAILDAARRVRDAGYRWWDCHTPFFVHGLDRAMGIRPTSLPVWVFGAGFTGAFVAMLLQWYTNATDLDAWFIVPVTGYKFLVSGKPWWSLPANVPVIFELMVLFAAIGCVVFLMLFNKLPWLYHPCFRSARFLRATDDRFFIVIEARDPQFYREKTERFLHSIGATAVEALED